MRLVSEEVDVSNVVKAFPAELRQCCGLWRSFFETKLEGIGQTLTRSRAILYLAESDKSICQKDLASLLSIEEPSVARMLVNMERDGLIEKRTASHDRRIKYILLTAAALPLVEKIKVIAEVAYREGLKDIPEEQLMIAHRVLVMIGKNIS